MFVIAAKPGLQKSMGVLLLAWMRVEGQAETEAVTAAVVTG